MTFTIEIPGFKIIDTCCWRTNGISQHVIHPVIYNACHRQE
ncbi:MAG: hypothetical protein ACTSWN_05395 [Promethearchaeota archaeon]